MTFEDMIQIVGVLDAILMFAIVIVYKEWRKAEKLVVTLLQDQVEYRSELIDRYNEFNGTIKDLVDILKD